MNDTAHREDVAGGLYDFPLREYSIQGRWPNPDPLGNSATCSKDPQTQNRYAYVRNNPVTYIDPTGGQFCDPEDPECCDPFDPFCFPPPPPPPGGPIGGGGGNGGNPEKPRAFPWPLLPLSLFGEPGGGGNPDTITVECGCKVADKNQGGWPLLNSPLRF